MTGAGDDASAPPASDVAPSARASAQLAARLMELAEWRSVATAKRACVAGFVAVRGEIDPAAALEQARAAGARVALPRVPSDEEVRARPGRPRLRFHETGADQLRPGRFGIPEPDPRSPEVEAAEIALLLVPGLAFDGRGNRLGFGGGYYDEWLSAAGARRPAFVVGVGFDFQVVDTCPAGENDARVDCVATDARVIRCPGEGTDER